MSGNILFLGNKIFEIPPFFQTRPGDLGEKVHACSLRFSALNHNSRVAHCTFSIASRIIKRELVSNRAAIAAILMLINTLISMDDDSTRYILLPNAIICKLEVLHDPVPSFVSRSLPYCQVVGL